MVMVQVLMIILKMGCKAKNVFMEMLPTMVKLLVVDIATRERINKTRDMMVVLMESSL
jgi:hypothetical protein